MEELIFLVEEAPEGGYTARALGESIFTEAGDMDGLREMVRDAVRCHLDDDRRRSIRLVKSGDFLRSCLKSSVGAECL
jgi:hypothetical protein